MSFFGVGRNKQSSNNYSTNQKSLPNRFVGSGGFVKVGAVKHEPRTNSAEEIKDSICLREEKYANQIDYPEKNLVETAKKCGVDLRELAKNSDIFETARSLGEREIKDENGRVLGRVDFAAMTQNEKLKKTIYEHNLEGLKNFIDKMSDMPQKHLSVAHDVLDLRDETKFINHNIFPEVTLDVLGRETTGEQTSFLQHVLGRLVQLSKENPAVMNLLDTVFSNSDSANSKFFLDKLIRNIDSFKGCEEQIEEAKEFVPAFAEAFLEGMPSMYLDDNCKENQFFSAIKLLCDRESKPENLKMMKNTMDIVDENVPNSTPSVNFELDNLRKGDTEKIKENLELLPELLKNAVRQGAKDIDVSGFLLNNVNLD